MLQTEQTIAICLFHLEPKDAAVFQRVMVFSQSQGRHFEEVELAQAQLVVATEQSDPRTLNSYPDNALLLRVVNSASAASGDMQLQRPLLVTRVMRALDEALKRLAVAKPIAESEPKPRPASPLVQGSVSAVAEPPPEHTEAAVATSPSTPSVKPAEATETTYQHTALVVDDSAAIRKQLQMELRQAGIGADFAETGEEALDKVASQTYDLIFLDIIMPGIDGFEACKQMRQDPSLKKTPIIMLSAKTSPLDEVQGVIAGASTYLTKPVKSEQLQKTLRRVSMWLGNFQGSRVS